MFTWQAMIFIGTTVAGFYLISWIWRRKRFRWKQEDRLWLQHVRARDEQDGRN